MAAHDTHTTGGRRPFRTQTLHAGSVYEGALTGNITLGKLSAQILKLDPGGSNRDVTLPPAEDGLWFEIVNAADGDEDLVVKDDGGTTIVTIDQNEKARVVSNGTAWVHLGIQTIALS